MQSITVQNLLSATAIYIGFVAVLFVLRKFLPGSLKQGQQLRDGTRKTYKLNGFLLLIVLALMLGVGQFTKLTNLARVNELFWPLLVVGNVFAFVHTFGLLAVGHKKSGKGWLEDFWFGPELNPDLWGVDLKMFAYMPSLMGLWVLNLSFAAMQYRELGHLTTRMALYETFFTIYIFNYFQFEYGMLHTWDVIAENFGFMLVWGDYVVVPFFYCICGWYMLRNTAPMPAYEVGALVLLFACGFWLFRGSNEQKHQYKENPKAPIWGKTPETVGGRLLVSGFWGIGRKLNYTGELMVYFSWTICTGFDSVVPYLLPFWLVCLFTHRAWRDEQRCAAKYGDLWREYCQRARFRMIPFVY
jgi:Delta14-sterol reductase